MRDRTTKQEERRKAKAERVKGFWGQKKKKGGMAGGKKAIPRKRHKRFARQWNLSKERNEVSGNKTEKKQWAYLIIKTGKRRGGGDLPHYQQ